MTHNILLSLFDLFQTTKLDPDTTKPPCLDWS
jgi:hypothetical protein